MQDPKEIEQSYEKPDPWGYTTNPEDIRRKQIILTVAGLFGTLTRGSAFYDRGLDIGAGEGWITRDLPVLQVDAFELSSQASSRIPHPIRVVKTPEGKYDLVTATGIFYAHYDTRLFLRLIREHACGIVISCNIKEWEIPEIKTIGKEIFTAEFSYREFTQKLRVFQV